MKSTIETISPIEKKITITIPSDVVDKEFDRTIKNIRNEVSIKGFRKGKIPNSLLEGMLKKEIISETENTLIKTFLPEALKENTMMPISMPKVDNGKLEKGNDFIFHVFFEIKPEINLAPYDDITLTSETAVVTDQEVDERIEALRMYSSKMEEETENRGVKDGDMINLDYSAHFEDKKIDKLSSDNRYLLVGKNSMIFPDFDKYLTGTLKEEEKKITITLPSDFAYKEFADKDIEIVFKVKEIKNVIKPELNDEFVKTVGDFTTVEDLKNRLADVIKEEKQHGIDDKNSSTLIEELIKRNDFFVPESLVDAQINAMIKESQKDYKMKGINLSSKKEELGEVREFYREGAVKTIKRFLILEEIAKKENISVSQEEADTRIKEMIDHNPKMKAYLLKYYSDEVNVETLKFQMIEEKTLKYLLEKNSKKVSK